MSDEERGTGRTERMLRQALENQSPGPTIIVGATTEHQIHLRDRFRKMAEEAGLEVTEPMPDTLDLHGRRVYFFRLDYVEEGKAFRAWPGPRYIDHFAVEQIIPRWFRRHLPDCSNPPES